MTPPGNSDSKLSAEAERHLDALCRRGNEGAYSRELAAELGYDDGQASVYLNVLMRKGLAKVSTHTQLWLATELGHEIRTRLLTAAHEELGG